ncbi:MAG: hypothetical protein IPJ49_28800 [Candidatus Obscuribacter sp.]|nr:hypothetical protein [Candidatus Obscuribacter sp.]
MQPAETLAHKFFSYTNRTIGGIDRKAKDLTDVAQMIHKGVDEDFVVKALEAGRAEVYSGRNEAS